MPADQRRLTRSVTRKMAEDNMQREANFRNQQRLTRSQTLKITRDRIQRCWSMEHVTDAVYSLVFGNDGQDDVDCRLHEDTWYPNVLISSLRHWYLNKILLISIEPCMLQGDLELENELQKGLVQALMTVHEMVQAEFLREDHEGVRFTFGCCTDHDGLELVPGSSTVDAHIWLTKDDENFAACAIDATAHFRSKRFYVSHIVHTACTAMSLHKTFCLKVRSLWESQLVIRRWKRIALVCVSWCRSAARQIKRFIKEREPAVKAVDTAICNLHVNGIQAESSVDPHFRTHKNLVVQVMLGLLD